MIFFNEPPELDPVDWNSAASIFIKMRDRPPPHIIVEIVTLGRCHRKRSYCRLTSPPPSEFLPHEAWAMIGRQILTEAREIEAEMMKECD